jgi:hypothetical protein
LGDEGWDGMAISNFGVPLDVTGAIVCNAEEKSGGVKYNSRDT